ncbi:hypothetical protein BK742_17070 [Bacillus thuringiensis serovar pingluonsis]|uniref:Uncharacterized protein n=1 Tax=Bacillus thuringiensis serovar pingluonsis TaxID=180881 RepID=A0A243BBL4_BACTU|nr:hypothetical protein BK742_17070 [Bacillus thuringiensis serovar pingluonsis]
MSFSTVQHRFKTSYIKKSLNPTIPVDPLASLDIFGQQRFSIQEPHLTKTILLLFKYKVPFIVCQYFLTFYNW